MIFNVNDNITKLVPLKNPSHGVQTLQFRAQYRDL